MFFEIKEYELLEKYNKIFDKVSSIIEKAFNTQPVFKEKQLKTKINYYNGKSITHFFQQINKYPKKILIASAQP